MYVLEALMKQDLKSKNTFVKVEADGQKTQTTTSIFGNWVVTKPRERTRNGIKRSSWKLKMLMGRLR